MDTNENNIIVALVAVGDKHVNEIIPYYNQLKRWGYNVKILTDQPIKFEIADVTVYTKHIFNYFDKLYFPLSIIKDYNQTVIYIDGSSPISKEQISQYTSGLATDFSYIESWPLGGFDEYKDKASFGFLSMYLDVYNMPIKNYPTIQERVMIFNKTINHELVSKELEMIQPVFDYMALFNYKMYVKPFVLGDGEGLAMSIILEKTNQSFLLHTPTN